MPSTSTKAASHPHRRHRAAHPRELRKIANPQKSKRSPEIGPRDAATKRASRSIGGLTGMRARSGRGGRCGSAFPSPVLTACGWIRPFRRRMVCALADGAAGRTRSVQPGRRRIAFHHMCALSAFFVRLRPALASPLPPPRRLRPRLARPASLARLRLKAESLWAFPVEARPLDRRNARGPRGPDWPAGCALGFPSLAPCA
jgi:hypothetical protein